MKIYLICDYRENCKGLKLNNIIYNDHASKISIKKIQESIIDLGYKCEIIEGTKELIKHCHSKAISSKDIYINLSDGTDHLHGRVQVPLISELYELNYSGANALQAAIANNKSFSKLFVNDLGIRTPKGTRIQKKDNLNLKDKFQSNDFPVIVKPNCLGSSIGIDDSSICYDLTELKKKIKKIRSKYNDIIIERYISGYEVTNLVIGNSNKNPINDVIIFSLNENFFFQNQVFGYSEKFKKLRKLNTNCEFICESLIQEIKTSTLKIKNTLGVNDIIRIDYRINHKGEVFFLEMNTAPRVSMTSEIGTICINRNLQFMDIIKLYIETVINRVS